MKRIFWLNIKRFDENVSKAPRLEIAEHLFGEGFSITLLTGYRNNKYFPTKHKLKIIYFSAIQKFGLFKVSLNLKIFYWLLFNIRENDIVIMSPGSLWMAYPIKLFLNCKIHLDFRTLPVEVNDKKEKLSYYLFWYLPLRLFFQVPDGYSFITELLKQSVEKEFKVSFRNHIIWHSGVNTIFFESVSKSRRTDNDSFIVTYLGVVTKNRGIDIVIKAIADLNQELKKRIVFKIIGDGPFLKTLKKIAVDNKLENQVQFTGYIPYEKVPNNLSKTDFFICPLPDRLEWNVSSPIKLFEYMACGKPFILTPIDAHKNIIEKSPFVVWAKSDSVEDIKAAIEYSYAHRKDLAEKAKLGPEIAKYKYDWKIQGKAFAMYLCNLMKEMN